MRSDTLRLGRLAIGASAANTSKNDNLLLLTKATTAVLLLTKSIGSDSLEYNPIGGYGRPPRWAGRLIRGNGRQHRAILESLIARRRAQSRKSFAQHIRAQRPVLTRLSQPVTIDSPD